MVLRDIIDEYGKLKNHLMGYKNFFEKGNEIIEQYILDTSRITGFDLRSDEINFEEQFLMVNRKYISALSDLYFDSISISYMFGQLSFSNFNTNIISEISSFNKSFDNLIYVISSIIKGKITNPKASYNVIDFIRTFQELYESYCHLYNSQLFLEEIEEQLFEPLPEKNNFDNPKNFELRSLKTNYDLSSYAQDLSLLSKFITQAQSIFNSSTQLYLRKIESGSLKITWSGKEVEISCISDIINAIINGIKSFAFLPSEIKIKKQEINKLELESEALAIENKSKKLAIVNSQIDIISEKLGLDKNNPEDVEKIQQLCIPLIGYLENNPVGCINDQKYDIDSSVKYLILKEQE